MTRRRSSAVVFVPQRGSVVPDARGAFVFTDPGRIRSGALVLEDIAPNESVCAVEAIVGGLWDIAYEV